MMIKQSCLFSGALVCFTLSVYAGSYVELGIAKGDNGSCISDVKIETGELGCSESPLGNLAIGYSYKGFAVEVEHWSSFLEKDKGLNLFTFKYRHDFNK